MSRGVHQENPMNRLSMRFLSSSAPPPHSSRLRCLSPAAARCLAVALCMCLGVQSAFASTYTVLYHFAGGTSDGEFPVAGVTIDAGNGDLYGTTFSGGASDKGIVYKLSNSGGTWTRTKVWE